MIIAPQRLQSSREAREKENILATTKCSHTDSTSPPMQREHCVPKKLKCLPMYIATDW